MVSSDKAALSQEQPYAFAGCRGLVREADLGRHQGGKAQTI